MGEQVAGFDWKPGANQITFAQAIDPNYFGRQGINPASAKGLRELDVESGKVTDLVQPERGLHLVAPKWSPDGRFLSFQEVYLMEGSGKFAFYDLDGQSYVAWDVPIGGYSWSQDGETIVYDDLTYIPQGNEAIYTRPREGGEAKLISPRFENGYAYSPVYGPGSDFLAYFVDKDGPEGNVVSLFVQEAPDREPREVGSYENPAFLSLTPGWHHVLMTRGPFEKGQILLVSPADGALTALAWGTQPEWNPAAALQ